jgi:hypothetical protein
VARCERAAHLRVVAVARARTMIQSRVYWSHVKTKEKSLYFILRYSDSLKGVDTYAQHKALQDKFGYVWWGKFGVGLGADIVQTANEQVKKGIPTYVFLCAEGTIKYKARLLSLVGGGVDRKYAAPEPRTAPSYYRKEKCAAWFKLAELSPARASDREKLVLYNAPTFRPSLNGMRGLIYVTFGSTASGYRARGLSDLSEDDFETLGAADSASDFPIRVLRASGLG